MKVEYRIRKKVNKFKDAITGMQKKYYSIMFQNEKSGKYTSGGTIMNSGKRVEVYVSPKKQQERTENRLNNQFIERHIDSLKQQRETGTTWKMLIDGVKQVQKVKDVNKKGFYTSIDYMWGEVNINRRDSFKAFISNYHKPMEYYSVEEACNPIAYKEFVNVIDGLTNKLKPSYLKSIWQSYVKVTLECYDMEWITKVGNPKKTKPSDKILRPEAKKQIYSATTDELKALDQLDIYTVKALSYTQKHTIDKYEDIRKAFLFSAIYTGLRPITMQNLKWKNITDKETHFEIYVRNNFKNEQEHHVKVSKECIEYIGDRKGDDDYVFPNYPRSTNKASNTVTISRSWENIRHHAGIENPKLTMRQCRHTHAFKTLTATNDNMWKVKERLGHKNVKTTMDNYARFSEDFYLDTMNELQDIDKFLVTK